MKNSIRWHYTNRDYFISDNPHHVRHGLISDELYDMGLYTNENNLYFRLNVPMVPAHMRVKLNVVNLDIIAYDILRGKNVDVIHFYNICNLLFDDMIDAIAEKHC